MVIRSDDDDNDDSNNKNNNNIGVSGYAWSKSTSSSKLVMGRGKSRNDVCGVYAKI